MFIRDPETGWTYTVNIIKALRKRKLTVKKKRKTIFTISHVACIDIRRPDMQGEPYLYTLRSSQHPDDPYDQAEAKYVILRKLIDVMPHGIFGKRGKTIVRNIFECYIGLRTKKQVLQDLPD